MSISRDTFDPAKNDKRVRYHHTRCQPLGYIASWLHTFSIVTPDYFLLSITPCIIKIDAPLTRVKIIMVYLSTRLALVSALVSRHLFRGHLFRGRPPVSAPVSNWFSFVQDRTHGGNLRNPRFSFVRCPHPHPSTLWAPHYEPRFSPAAQSLIITMHPSCEHVEQDRALYAARLVQALFWRATRTTGSVDIAGSANDHGSPCLPYRAASSRCQQHAQVLPFWKQLTKARPFPEHYTPSSSDFTTVPHDGQRNRTPSPRSSKRNPVSSPGGSP